MATQPVIVDCASVSDPDLGVIDLLARLRLAARRRGRELLLRNAGDRLLELIRLCGLGGVLRVEPERETEQRKELGRVEEEGDLGDLSV